MSYCLLSNFVKYSFPYGTISLNSKYFDDSKDLGGTEQALLNYTIKNIKIFSCKKEEAIFINGVQLTYKNKRTNELKELEIRKGNIEYEEEEVETFEIKSGEYLTNFYIRIPKDKDIITQIGFETNKKRKILKGEENGENRTIYCNGGQNIIIGTFGHYNQKLDAFGVLFINSKEYIIKFYKIYFDLKFKLKKDEKYRKKIESKYEALSESYKYLLRTCLLPDNPFVEVLKFCFF